MFLNLSNLSLDDRHRKPDGLLDDDDDCLLDDILCLYDIDW